MSDENRSDPDGGTAGGDEGRSVADEKRTLTAEERAEIERIWVDPDDDGSDEEEPVKSTGDDGSASFAAIDDDSDGALPLERRDLLKWGVAGAALNRSWLRSGRFGDGDASGPRTLQMKSAPRDYLPSGLYPLSIRGIAPRQSSSGASAVWNNSGGFSVDDLIADQGFNRRPISLREIVTPQQTGTNGGVWSNEGWENWLDDHERSSADEFVFSGRKQVIQAVSDNVNGDFRAVGSGHSHSEAAKPRSNFTDVKGLSGKRKLRWIRDPDDPNDPDDDFWDRSGVDRSKLIRLGAGTVLKDLNRKILPGEGLALQNMGSFDGQTLAGAINTSTHGTGLGLGTFADLVRSVDIVTVPESPIVNNESVVRMFRIEPETDENGDPADITDPVKFGKETDRHDMALIQDDEIFHNAVVGYGSLGVACTYTLELRDSYWLREETEIKNWNNVNPYQEAQNHRHYNLLIDLAGPQVSGTRNPLVQVKTRDIVSSRGRNPTERRTIGGTIESVTEAILEEIGSLPKDVVNNLNDPQAEIEDIPEQAMQNIAEAASPFKGGRNETIWHYSLRRVPDTKGRNAKPEPPNYAITTEVAVPASQVKSAVGTVFDAVQSTNRFFPIPLGVRFTGSSPHNFSAEYERETAMLEFIIPVPPGLRKNINSVQTANDTSGPFGPVYTKPKKILWQKIRLFFQAANLMHFADLGKAKQGLAVVEDPLVAKHDGRPHLGKFNSVETGASRSYMRPDNMYNDYDEWTDAYDYFNQFGTFDSDFTDNKVQ